MRHMYNLTCIASRLNFKFLWNHALFKMEIAVFQRFCPSEPNLMLHRSSFGVLNHPFINAWWMHFIFKIFPNFVFSPQIIFDLTFSSFCFESKDSVISIVPGRDYFESDYFDKSGCLHFSCLHAMRAQLFRSDIFL